METLLVLEPSERYSRYSEGAVLALEDNQLFFAYTRFEGESNDNARASIVGRLYHPENGWSDERILVKNEGDCNVMSVSLLRLASGGIRLFYCLKNSLMDCKLYMRTLSEKGQVGKAKICATPHDGYHVINNDRVIQLSSGRLIVPAAFHPCTDGTYDTWSSHADAIIFFSDDEGQTWQKGARIKVSNKIHSGLQEPGVVELTDGQLYLWARTDMGCQYQSFSKDGGQTWTTPKPSELISPLSPASIKRVRGSSDLLAIYNDHSGNHLYFPHRRNPLCISKSIDGGEHWSVSRLLEKNLRGWYCYSSMTFLNGDLLLSYCAGDQKVGLLNRLKLVRVPCSEF